MEHFGEKTIQIHYEFSKDPEIAKEDAIKKLVSPLSFIFPFIDQFTFLLYRNQTQSKRMYILSATKPIVSTFIRQL